MAVLGPRPGRLGTRGTNVDDLIALVADRLAGNSPQGSTGGKTGAKYTGYDTATEQKQAITGLGSYYKAQDTAVQDLIDQAARAGYASTNDLMQKTHDRMLAAGDAANAGDAAVNRSQWNNMASEYAGKSAQLYADQHPAPPEQPNMTPAGTGAGGGVSSVFAAKPQGQALLVNPAAQSVGASNRDVLANQQQAVSDAPLVAGAAPAHKAFEQAQTDIGTVGPRNKAEFQNAQAQDQALNDLLYGSDTPYMRQAAIDMGVDPLVAWGMNPDDTPSEQIAQQQHQQDLVSLDQTGMTASEAAAATKQATADQAKANTDAINSLIEQSTGLSSNAAESRSGLTAEQIASITQQPDWGDIVKAQDQMLSSAQAGDTTALSQLNDLLNASDLSTDERRLLRARMQGLGITDAELAAASG